MLWELSISSKESNVWEQSFDFLIILLSSVVSIVNKSLCVYVCVSNKPLQGLSWCQRSRSSETLHLDICYMGHPSAPSKWSQAPRFPVCVCVCSTPFLPRLSAISFILSAHKLARELFTLWKKSKLDILFYLTNRRAKTLLSGASQ